MSQTAVYVAPHVAAVRAAGLNAYGATPDTLAMLKSSATSSSRRGVAAEIERVLATH